MRNIYIILLSLLVSTLTFSQDKTLTFSLKEAINFALENNRTAKNASRDVTAAEKRKWETTATGLPQLDANIDYQNWLKQQVSLLPAEITGGNPGEFTELAFGTKQNMNASITLNQLLFDGSYLVGLQSAKVYLEISQNAKTKTDLEVRKAVINAYGNVLLTEEGLKILEHNKIILQQNVDETTKIFENGLEEEESVEQLQITLSDIESSFNKTSRLKILAYQMLNINLGVDINTDVKLIDDLQSLTTQNIVLELLNSEENIENTIDYKIAFNDKTSKELLLKLEKSKALPSLNAFINGAYAGYSENFTFTNSYQKWFGSSLFGVSMNIPIFSSGMRSAATQRAKINLEKAEDDLTETEQRLKFKISASKNDYQFAIEDFNNKKQNLNLAERIEKKNQTKFFEGLASSFELRQAQIQLYTAQQGFLQAMIDVINKKAELETVLNTIDNY